jgi:hypothetical protein
VKGLDFPWYKEWTGVDVVETDMNKDNVQHVYDELTGRSTTTARGGPGAARLAPGPGRGRDALIPSEPRP